MVMSSEFNLDNCERMLYKHRIQLVANSILDDLGTKKENRLNGWSILDQESKKKLFHDDRYR